jgi:hypothetical protein
MIISDNGFMGDPSELVIKKIAEREREKIARLEAALASMKSAHVTGATVHPALCDEYPKVCANNRIAELETALREIQDHCAGKTGSLQAVVVVIVRKALEGR